jgi:uncharacterized coiled-coil DUF342 family protein
MREEIETLFKARKELTDHITKHNFGYMHSDREIKTIQLEIDKLDKLILNLVTPPLQGDNK